MSVSIQTAAQECLKRMGDASEAIWTQGELEGYLVEAERQLALDTKMFWDIGVLPDWPMAFTHTYPWEAEYRLSGWAVGYCAQFTAEFERDFVDNGRGPANHNYFWEYLDGHVSTLHVSAVEDLPDNVAVIERSTWNTRRIDPMKSREIERWDTRYELNTGEVEAYLRDKDGLDVLRKWQKPGAAYSPHVADDPKQWFTHTYGWEVDYMPSNWTIGSCSDHTARFETGIQAGPLNHTAQFEVDDGYNPDPMTRQADQFGLLRRVSTITDAQVIGDWGILRIVAGQEATGQGEARAIYKDTSCVRYEFIRRPRTVQSSTDDFEVPDRYVRYLRFFAIAKALEREGPGQELQLAARYWARYQAGLTRANQRRSAMNYQKGSVMGGRQGRAGRPPKPRLPWNYGSVVRR